MKEIIAVASALALLAAGSGKLPKIVNQVRIAQLQILKEMKTKDWGQPWTPIENLKAKK